MKKHRIDTVDGRSKLTPRNAPYWVKLGRGLSLGFRKTSASGDGAWLARITEDTGKEVWKSLGSLTETTAADRYFEAKKAAEKLGNHIEEGGSVKGQSVKAAGAAYVEHLRAEDREGAAKDVAARLKRWVDNAHIGKVDVLKLTPKHVQAWRQTLIATQVVANIHAEEKLQNKRKRAPATINREMAALRAVLNHALRLGIASSDKAWRVALLPVKVTGGKRTTYLDRQQRAALVNAAEPLLGKFLTGLALLPLRPGALADLTAGDFDKRTSSLRIGKDKAGSDRSIMLPSATAAFIASQCEGKLPAAHIFTREAGKKWGKDYWKHGVKDAALASGLPLSTTAYTLRHSIITDLVSGGLDVLTVARLSGTSIGMIEKHYGHLRQEHAASALATLAL